MARPADPNARDALVAAARAEFFKRSLRGARIEDITAACGLSKGSFYLHFESKEALFGELVDAFSAAMAGFATERSAAMEAFIEEHGAPNRRDVEQRTPRFRRLLELETEFDLRFLEYLWSMRDVVAVMISGAQGTRFEGAIWQFASREVDRISQLFGAAQKATACRTDVPPEVFGSMIVGTYVLLAMRMSGMTGKPDLAGWARSLHSIVREGSIAPAPPAASSKEPRPHRSRA